MLLPLKRFLLISGKAAVETAIQFEQLMLSTGLKPRCE